MGATSNHYGDITAWIEKVIDSCTSPLHEEAVVNLIRLYVRKLKFDGKPKQLVWVIEKHLFNRLAGLDYRKITKNNAALN